MGIDSSEIDLATLRSDRFPARLAEQQGVVVIDAEQESDIALILAAAALRAGRHTVIRTCQRADQLHEIDALCQQHQMTRQQLG